MDSSQDTRDQGVVNAVDVSWWSAAEEGQYGLSVSQQGHGGDSLFRCVRYHSHRLSWKGYNDHRFEIAWITLRNPTSHIQHIFQINPLRLFTNMKKWLGKRFGSKEEVIGETEVYFADLLKSYFLDGLNILECRWTKCIECNLQEFIDPPSYIYGCDMKLMVGPTDLPHHQCVQKIKRLRNFWVHNTKLFFSYSNQIFLRLRVWFHHQHTH